MSTSSSRSRLASGAKRLTGRSSKSSLERLPNLGNLLLGDSSRGSDGAGHSQPDQHLHAHTKLHGAVKAWLQEERTKWQSRTAVHGMILTNTFTYMTKDITEKSYAQVAFEGLEKILSDHAIVKHQRPIFPGPKRMSSTRRIRNLSLVQHASDTEYSGDDPIVPTTDEVLDNSKTVGKNGTKEAEAWLSFKNEIIKLAHTLRLKGWRRIDLNAGDDIKVERLSGALTNAVYVVVPPKNLPKTPVGDSDRSRAPKRNPV